MFSYLKQWLRLWLQPKAISADSNGQILSVSSLYQAQMARIYQKNNRFILAVLLVQWLGWWGYIGNAYLSDLFSVQSLWGVGLTLFTVASGYFLIQYPTASMTRHLLALTQAAFSISFYYVTLTPWDGIFHAFASLAMLSLYRDWRVLLTLTMLVSLHALLSWDNLNTTLHWREYLLWLLFENLFLMYACKIGAQEMTDGAEQQFAQVKINENLSKEIVNRIESEDELLKLKYELESRVEERTEELAKVNGELAVELAERKRIQARLVQSQKMESIGQLAAGVAHEINNPVGFIMSNLGTLQNYVGIFKQLLQQYGVLTKTLQQGVLEPIENQPVHSALAEIHQLIQKEDVPFILSDVDALLLESQEGTKRVQDIVKNLKSFARLDESTYKYGNIHEGLDSTLKIVWNETKYKCDVIKKYGDIPSVCCNHGQLNQVFMNLIVNAVQAIETKGTITLETTATAEQIIIKIADTGSGIPSDKLHQIFDPFFTTKPVGKGTGLGLSISYGIIQEHGGKIEVTSEVGKGTCFTIHLPLQSQPNPVQLVPESCSSNSNVA